MKVDEFIQEYCRKSGVKLVIDPKLGKDDGLCYPSLGEVHLSKRYSSSKLKLAILLHEIGHVKIEKQGRKPYNIFECELMAWNYAIKMHKRYFSRSFSKTQAEYMLKCLKGYCCSQYEFKKLRRSKV